MILHPTAIRSQPTAQPVHPNSHASMLSDPGSFSTSEITKRALENHAILPALVHSLISPVPFGPDGDSEGDPDFEQNIIQ